MNSFPPQPITPPPLEPVESPEAAAVTRTMLWIMVIMAVGLGLFLLMMFGLFLYLIFRKRC